MNISLPQPMSEYVRREVSRDYGNVSEFFRRLVRDRMERESAADVAFLETAMAEAAPGPSASDIEDVLAIQKQVRKALRARGV